MWDHLVPECKTLANTNTSASKMLLIKSHLWTTPNLPCKNVLFYLPWRNKHQQIFPWLTQEVPFLWFQSKQNNRAAVTLFMIIRALYNLKGLTTSGQFEHFLIDGWCEKVQPTWESWVLKKQSEHALSIKPVASTSPWPRHQLLHLGSCLEFLSQFSWMIGLPVIRWNKSFPVDYYHSTLL